MDLLEALSRCREKIPQNSTVDLNISHVQLDHLVFVLDVLFGKCCVFDSQGLHVREKMKDSCNYLWSNSNHSQGSRIPVLGVELSVDDEGQVLSAALLDGQGQGMGQERRDNPIQAQVSPNKRLNIAETEIGQHLEPHRLLLDEEKLINSNCPLKPTQVASSLTLAR